MKKRFFLNFLNFLNFFSLIVLSMNLIFFSSCGKNPSENTEDRAKDLTKSPTPLPPPPLKVSYASLKHHLIERSCLGCHGTASSAQLKLKDLSIRGNVESLAEDIHYSISEGWEMDILGMPPKNSSAPFPTEEIKRVFKEWMDAGFPD